MLHQFILQVWQHVLFIYIFYKFSFFSKNLFQQQKNFQIDLKSFFVAETNFLWKKMLCNKRKIPGDTQNFFMKLQHFEKLVAISWKSRSCPQSFKLGTFQQWAKGSREREQVKDQPHIDFCSLSNNSKYRLGAPHVTTVFPTWAYDRFKEIQSNFRRKKLHRTN